MTDHTRDPIVSAAMRRGWRPIAWIDRHPSDAAAPPSPLLVAVTPAGHPVATDGRSARTLPPGWRDRCGTITPVTMHEAGAPDDTVRAALEPLVRAASIARVAKDAGVSAVGVSNWLNRKADIRVSTAERIAAAVGMRITVVPRDE